MATKAADLDTFLDTQEKAVEEQPRRRTKGKKDIVCLTLRFTHAQWRKAHDLSLSEGVSINQPAIEGISRILSDKGLPRM